MTLRILALLLNWLFVEAIVYLNIPQGIYSNFRITNKLRQDVIKNLNSIKTLRYLKK